MRAFGGPHAQIAMMKTELVDDEKWISVDRWNRVYALYQVVPGPEAFELACYFGMICKGRFGAFLGGIGFALPGVLLELLASWLYTQYGFSDPHVRASFKCIQVVVSAFIFRAAFKLSESTLLDSKTKAFVWDRGFICLWNYLTAVIGLNFFASMAISGVMNYFFVHKDKFKYGPYIAYLTAALTIVGFFLYVGYEGQPSTSVIGDTSSAQAGTDTSYGSLLILGLIAGCVSFGGAVRPNCDKHTTCLCLITCCSTRPFLSYTALPWNEASI
jgi:chromate transporter